MVTHGIASLLANNAMVYDEAYCIKILSNAYFGAMYLLKEAAILAMAVSLYSKKVFAVLEMESAVKFLGKT